MSWDSLRLARLSVASKLLVTLFLLIIGPGYLFGVANIFIKHHDADIKRAQNPVEDLKATFQREPETTVNSAMLEQVRPGGEMREHLEDDESATRGLIAWLEAEAKEADFDKSGLLEEGDPSAKEAIASYCIYCHNSDDGDMPDVPFAETADSEPQYDLVYVSAEATIETEEAEVATISFKDKRLVHITHAHILTIPVFTLLVGALFMMTGFGRVVKILLGPLPMLAVLLDIGSWWMARFSVGFIYAILAAGAVFGVAYGLQILGILCSMWFGRREDPAPSGE